MITAVLLRVQNIRVVQPITNGFTLPVHVVAEAYTALFDSEGVIEEGEFSELETSQVRGLVLVRNLQLLMELNALLKEVREGLVLQR